MVALIVANPWGFIGLLASTGYFIIRCLLGIIEILLAVIYWGFKNVAVAVANAFIALLNFGIGMVNALFSWIVDWFSKVGLNIEWNGIPTMAYLIASPAPQTIYDVIAEIGLGWQGVVSSWNGYMAGTSPGSWTLGAGAGAISAGATWRISSDYLEYEKRRRRYRPV